MPAPSASAAIYVRRSARDADGSARNGRSLAEQEQDARSHADRLGLEVVEVFAEREGTGASRRSGKARPVWLRALAALEAGESFTTLIVWELSRADRRGWAALDGVVERLAEKGRRLVGVDGTDLTDPTQRLANVIRAEMAREEAESIGKRVARTKRAARTRGVWLGGPTPFGTTTDADQRLCPDPETYPIARAIAEAYLSGASLWKIVSNLNGEEKAPRLPGLPFGLPSPRGGRWTVGTVSAWLRSPSIAGLATQRERAPFSEGGRWAAIGDVLRDEDGQALTVGKGVITEAEFLRIRQIQQERTSETGRRTAIAKRPARARRGPTGGHLLAAGLGRCRCGAALQVYGVTVTAPLGSLRCSAYGLTAGCPAGKPGQGPRQAVELYVLGQVWAALVFAKAADLPLWHSVMDAWKAARLDAESGVVREARADVESARSALHRVEDAFGDGTLDHAAFARQRERLSVRLAAAERSLGELTQAAVPAFDEEEPWDVLRRWAEDPTTDVADRRRLIALAVESVTLLPAPGRGVRFDSEKRVEIAWRDPGVSGPASVFQAVEEPLTVRHEQ